MTTVLVTGTFDIIHPGHLNFLNQAKKHGDDLVVIIARDENVKRIKGRYPVHNEVDRRRSLEQFDPSLKVVLGDLDDPYTCLHEHKPDVICLGYDQNAFVDRLEHYLKENDLKAKVLRMQPYKEKLYKSSLLKSHVFTEEDYIDADQIAQKPKEGAAKQNSPHKDGDSQ